MSCNRHDFDDREAYPVKDDVDKGWLSGVYWKGKHDALMADYQELIHKYEELKSEVASGHRNNDGARSYLLGGDKES